MHRFAPVLAIGVLAGTALLLPTSASAETSSYWSTAHQKSAARVQVADSANGITWTVLDHKIIITTPDLLVVPLVYTCGTKADPKDVQYDPAAFQTVYDGFSSAAYSDVQGETGYPTFSCDGASHVTDVVLPRQEGRGFENGNIEIGMVKANTETSPTFEHATVGYDQLHDNRASVDVTVNVAASIVKPGSKITVKGTIKRDGKAYKGKAATLYFQTKAGDPATKIGSATADAKGKLTTKVTVTDSGTYFWTTTSTSKTQAGASLGDYAAKPEK